MTVQAAGFPVREPLSDKTTGLITNPWRVWLRNLQQSVNSNASTLTSINVTSKSDAIALTPFAVGSLTSGMYRASAVLQITTAGSLSSSLSVTFHFTLGSKACTVTSAANTTNDPTVPLCFSAPVSIDAGSPISYSTTYAANAANSMIYGGTFTLEAVHQQ